MFTSLARHERESELWKKLDELLRSRLAEYRSKNDALTLDHDDTLILRGRIAEVKALLAIGDEPPQFGKKDSGRE